MDNDPMSPSLPLPGGTGDVSEWPYGLSPEELPDVENLVIEDGKPVENIVAEKQQRLLTEPLFSSWAGPGGGREFLALANVGLFFQHKQPPLAPDVMLALDVPQHRDLTQKENRSYLIWEMGRPPRVVFEFVSDRRGGEDTHKLNEYAGIGVTYYVIFDPQDRLGGGVVRAFSLRDGVYVSIPMSWLPAVGLGLTQWRGAYEGQTDLWLRWCDEQGQLILTGRERAEKERERADKAEQRADDVHRRAARLAELSRKTRLGQATPEELEELQGLEEQMSPPSP